MSEKLLPFNLKEIASWQLETEQSPVELPPLQRGFVWKVNQIEAVWDSILRGFPIGSFLLSKSEDGQFFLLDGQQRATSIAIGYYNPWCINEKSTFWSLKSIPVVWIDLMPTEKTDTQKFVIRVVTQSHPWGYQRKNNNAILSYSERKNALNNFKSIPGNEKCNYIQLSLLKVFPHDADLPVPLSFIIEAITQNKENWKTNLISKCKLYLPVGYIKKSNGEDYIEKLTNILNNITSDNEIVLAIKSLQEIKVPGIVVKSDALKDTEEKDNDDSTLFIRLNASGTRIAGEELIYSMYKASFRQAKDLVENIGADFVPPSLVISLVSRLILAEITGNYPYPITVNEFRKKLDDDDFKDKLKGFIGDKMQSPAKDIFSISLDLLLSKDEYLMPPVLVKNLVRSSPDLFLMLLQWVKINKTNLRDNNHIMLSAITALAWFGKDNKKYVREIWKNISEKDFWSKETLKIPIKGKKDFVMYPLISPSVLREYLLKEVVENKKIWDDLYPDNDSHILKSYRNALGSEVIEENDISNDVWDDFIKKLIRNRSLVLFAQRAYIKENFGEFNQMDNLEDTNSPWDWDHIYPSSWVYNQRWINPNTRHWSNSIGNLRALSLDENRSEGDSLSPKIRLEDSKEKSFVGSDWEYWSQITDRINEGNQEMITIHLHAIIDRLCNIYEHWYDTLSVGALFNYDEN